MGKIVADNGLPHLRAFVGTPFDPDEPWGYDIDDEDFTPFNDLDDDGNE